MVKLFIRSTSLKGAEGVAREMWRAHGVNNDILAQWRLRPMFTQAALRASVFIFETLFLSNSVFWLGRVFAFFFTDAWPKRDSTHTVDGNFQLREIIFLEYRARKAAWVNMGF